MTDKNQEARKDADDNKRPDITSPKISQVSNEADARAYRAALAANPDKRTTLSPDGQSRFSINDDESTGKAPDLTPPTGPDEQVAQDWNQIKQMARDTGELVLEKAGTYPHRDHEDKYVDYKAAQEAFKVAHLDQYELPKNLIGAIMRNEQHYYKTTDAEQDKQVKEKGSVFKNGKEDESASIGPAQIQIRNIKHLVEMKDEDGKPEYPYLQHMAKDPVRSALDPKNAALLVAAYTNEIIKDQKAHGIEKPSAEQVIYGYNDDVNSFGSGKDKKFVCVSAPGEVKAERIAHKDLKREMYPIDPTVTKISAHVQHVMSQLAKINKDYP